MKISNDSFSIQAFDTSPGSSKTIEGGKGGAVKGSPKKMDGVAQTKLLTAQAVKQQAAVAGSVGNKPELARPQSGALKMNAAEMKNLEKVLDQAAALLPMMPGVLEAEDKSVAEPAEKRAGETFSSTFDITKMSSLPASDLLMMVSFLLRILGIANTAFEGKLTIIASKAADMSAESIKKDGYQKMSTSIAQGAAMFTTAATGAGLKIAGHKKESNNLARNGKTMEANALRTQGANDALAGSKGKLNPAGEVADIKLKPENGGADASIDLAPSNKTLSNTDQATIAGSVSQESTAAADASKANQAAANNYTIAGDALVGFGTAMGGMISGGGHLMTSKEEALQKIIDVLARASSQSSDNSREQARAAVAMIVEMLHAMLDALKSRAATVSTIAGNIRG